MSHKIYKHTGTNDFEARQVGNGLTEIKIGDKRATVFTEDLAVLVRDLLPKDRGAKMFSEIEEKMVTKGKVRIVLKAGKRIEKGDDIVATLDITKYVDQYRNPLGMRVNNSGFLY